MYFVGIDISKYKHDCFITTETGVTIKRDFTFDNNKNGFDCFITLLNSLDKSQEIRIGFEATGQYQLNLMLYLEKHNFSFMEFNPALVKKFISTTTLRKTKTDKADAIAIARYLMSVDYKPHPKQFYHKYVLKSLTRRRITYIHHRSKYKVDLTHILDAIFPEFKPFFNNKFSVTAMYILNKYHTVKEIAEMTDYDDLRKISRGHFYYSKFISLKELANNTVGEDSEIYTFQLISVLKFIELYDNEILSIENKIDEIMNELKPKCASIKGLGNIITSSIIAEYGDISRFKSADAMLAYAGLEPSTIQSGQTEHTGRMVKRGSSFLRASLMCAAEYVFMHEPVFTDFYYKKRGEGKGHRTALSHVAKKLVRVIYKIETSNVDFDRTKLR